MKKIILGVGMGLCLLPMASQAIERGEMLANTCFSCHGYEGKMAGGQIIPLAQYPASMIISQMKAYKNGTREGTIMSRHAKGYTDEEIELLAQFIGDQTK